MAGSDCLHKRVKESEDQTTVLRLNLLNWQLEESPENALKSKIASGPPVVFDLSEVQEMTTVYFAQLVIAKCEAQKRGRKVIIRGLQKQPQELCELLKLDRLLLEEDYCPSIMERIADKSPRSCGLRANMGRSH